MKLSIDRWQTSFLVPAALAVLVLILLPVVGSAKLVVCIDHHADTEEGFVVSAEGWARGIAKVPPDVICLGGTLTDCLANLEDEDSLIIICHALCGDEGEDEGYGFSWCGNDYVGFGQGDTLMTLPQGFGALKKIWFLFVSCWTENDPDGAGPQNPDKPLVDKLDEAMGGDANNHDGHGFADTVEAKPRYQYPIPGGMTEEQIKAWKKEIDDCLAADDSWMDSPPVNRSDPPPVPNQQTEAQRIINDCDIQPRPTIVIDYPNPPQDKPPPPAGKVTRLEYGGLTKRGDYCETVTWEALPLDQAIPTVSQWGLIIFGVVLLGFITYVFLRRRKAVVSLR